MQNFLAYLDHWKQSVEKRTGPFTRADRKQMMLSDITQNEMKITGIYCLHSRYFSIYVLLHL